MMENDFITNDFLLENDYAAKLYHKFAAPQPIIDYHNHLSPSDIAHNKSYENITQLWIQGDHYKWRMMRALGIDEKYITGDATDKEKFLAWGKTVPHTLRNPLFHWTQLELKRYFGITELLNEHNAERIYDSINERLTQPDYSCRGLLNRMNVETLCTTEDPIDDLKYHKQMANDDFGIQVSTAFRPDKAIEIDAGGFLSYIEQLGEVADITIQSYRDLCDALHKRLLYFHENGCRLCDHGLPYIYFESFSQAEVIEIFSKRIGGKEITKKEAEKFKTSILLFLGEIYHDLGWVQQFHLGALRNTNSRALKELGPDTGWDSIGDYRQAESMAAFFDALNAREKLTKTIIYNLNPAYNEVFGTMVGNFNDGSVKGKIQYGAAWWFLDQKDGIRQHLNTLSNTGLLSCFIGMLTDSRSFLSFTRHEYFRRILSNLLGSDMEKGLIPRDMDLVGELVTDICYKNAKEYFPFNDLK